MLGMRHSNNLFSENKLFVTMTDNVLNSYGNTFYLCQCQLHGKIQCAIWKTTTA